MRKMKTQDRPYIPLFLFLFSCFLKEKTAIDKKCNCNFRTINHALDANLTKCLSRKELLSDRKILLTRNSLNKRAAPLATVLTFSNVMNLL